MQPTVHQLNPLMTSLIVCEMKRVLLFEPSTNFYFISLLLFTCFFFPFHRRYAGKTPPDRQCCYCGEESSLECNLCAKTGYATYFCSAQHQALMWKDHMAMHERKRLEEGY